MSYNVHIQDQDYQPLRATVVYSDGNGKGLGSQEIPAEGGTLNSNLLTQADTVTFSAPGYYDFYAATTLISDGDNDVTMQKKPTSIWLALLLGAAAVYGGYRLKLFKL